MAPTKNARVLQRFFLKKAKASVAQPVRLVLYLLYLLCFSDRAGAVGTPGVHRGRRWYVGAQLGQGEHPGGRRERRRQEGGPPAHWRHPQVRISTI